MAINGGTERIVMSYILIAIGNPVHLSGTTGNWDLSCLGISRQLTSVSPIQCVQ